MRSGRKSEAQTPSPKKDRIYGSKRNPKGSASSSKSASKIQLSQSIITTLENKRDEYNAKHPSGKVTLATLKAVFRRGAGAFSSSHRPNMTRSGWAFARVNKFLLKKGGTKVKAAYVQDDDLMERGGEIELLAPNGKPSNLTHEQWHLVRTPKFKAWFGDWENNPENASKVVDENGEPLICYHGTYAKEQFKSFDFDKADLGFHFGTYEQAKDRSKTKIGFKEYESIVNPYFLNIKKKFSITDIGEFEYPKRYLDELISDNLISESEAKANKFYEAFYREDNKKIREFLLKKHGKNIGFEYNNKYEAEGKSFIVLHPNQIKLADGSNITFDGNNPDIRYEDGGLTASLDMAMENLKKNGIVLNDGAKTTTVIAYNTGNQEVSPSLYNKSLIYKSVQPIKSANEIIQNFDLQDFERFKEGKIEEYKKSHLIITNQNEVVYDNSVAEGGDLGQEIICRGCGWSWNTNNSDEFDKYVCHKCGFDNRTYYDSDPIGYAYGGLIAPNGKKSNLTTEQYKLVRTPEFKAWFGDWENDPQNSSKVVDENGEPKVMYHGSRGDFNIFSNENPNKLGWTEGGLGFYFTTYSDSALGYGRRVIAAFINAKNIKKSDESEHAFVTINQLNKLYQEGYDSIYFDGQFTKTNGQRGWKEDELVVFEPNQIKLADGSNTTFDAENPDIRYKNGGNIENEFDDLDNNQLVKTLKSFYSDLSESPIFEYLDLKVEDYNLNIGDKEFVIFKKKPFSEIEAIKIGRFIEPYFDASKKPLFSRFFDSYKVIGNNIIIKLKDMYENGGLFDEYGGQLKSSHTILEIAQKHNVKVTEIVKALVKGQKMEREHTYDDKIAKTIAKHHLWESPIYYDKLKEMEKTFEDGGKINLDEIALPDSYSNIDNLNRILQNQGYHITKIKKNKDIFDKGGMVVGKSHQEADENGTGEKFKLKSTGQIVELEGGEAVIVGSAIDSEDKISFNGSEMTPREVASYLNHKYGGIKFEKGGHITCGCSQKKYYHGGELSSSVVDSLQGGEAVITKKTMESSDKYQFEGEKLTPRQILSRINHRYGGVSFAKGGQLTKFSKDPVSIASKMIYFVNNMIYG